jgi:Tfp pilus assembly protein PilF
MLDAYAGSRGDCVLMASLDRGLPNEKLTQAAFPEEDSMRVKDYNDRGVDYSRQGEYELALKEFNKALAVDNGTAETYNNRGITYAKLGRYELAIADFKKALEIKHESAEFNYNLGITYAKEGQFESALSKVNKAIEIKPSDSLAYTTRARMYMDLACSDWMRACDAGNCNYLREAAKLGLCEE